MKKVYVVSGAPGSGKSTYAKTHAGKNDVIFDLDEINRAMGGGLHAENEKVLHISLAMRSAAIAEIAKRQGKWENAWFITASADREEVRRLCEKLDAEEIRMTADLETCRKNIMQDSTRTQKERDILLAEAWYRQQPTRVKFAEWAEKNL